MNMGAAKASPTGQYKQNQPTGAMQYVRGGYYGVDPNEGAAAGN